MAVTVAPLTTVVMNSVNQEHVGVASGINNAVARVAGVLAIAVRGVVMVSAFTSRLNVQLGTVSLPPNAVHEIQSNEARLADRLVRAGVEAVGSAAIKQVTSSARAYESRAIMLVCAG